MTPHQMRQQASRNRIEANVLDESAQVLHTVAASLRGLLAGIAGLSRTAWQGPAATRFEEEAEEHSRNVDAQATEIASEASGFAHRADSLRSDASRLLTEAARVEAEQAAAAAASGAV